MENKKNLKLNDGQLKQVTGGHINVFDVPSKSTWWDFTCLACGNKGCISIHDNIHKN